MKANTSNKRHWTPRLPTASDSQPLREKRSVDSPAITAEELSQVREPIRWILDPGVRSDVSLAANRVRAALRGASSDTIDVPEFLLEHQRDAFRRICGILRTFGGACLCDAVGLGKTYVSLAVASRYQRVRMVLPRTVVETWRLTAQRLGIHGIITTHEQLSRQPGKFDDTDLVIVDEAHRFRNSQTRRYRHLSRCLGPAHVLLVTATPVVNSPRDLLHLLRLFLADHTLAVFGVRSLEGALAGRVTRDVLKSATPLLVARSPAASGIPASELPFAVDVPAIQSAPVPKRRLRRLLDKIQGLEFPAFAHPEAPQLLRSHLFYRLHSSVPALRTSLKRHRSYLDRATAALETGGMLTRRDARSLFDPDDAQLDLDLVYADLRPASPATTSLAAERQRIDSILDDINLAGCTNPKLNRLIRYLATRNERRTVIFVNAIPTAQEIARQLGWKQVATVTGGRARIASGMLSLDETVALFAPDGKGRAGEQARTAIRTLVTTDILSEGVNLQAADAIVHYDLPWTPLRLQQRIGRIRRLGSDFATVSVLWFVPHPLLERRLDLQARLQRKLDHQMRFGVPLSSAVGRATIANRVLEQREILAGRRSDGDRVNGNTCHAVVKGSSVAAYSVRWLTDRGPAPDVLLVAAREADALNLADSCEWLNQLMTAPTSTVGVPDTVQSNARRLIRHRLADGLAGPINGQMRSITRTIVSITRSVRGADPMLLHQLDTAMQLLQRGARIGAEWELRDILDEACNGQALRQWIRRWAPTAPQILGVEIDAVLSGDGSREGEARSRHGTGTRRIGKAAVPWSSKHWTI